MSDIKWKSFNFSQDGVNITVNWWAKDFKALYKTEFGVFSYGLHMMYACPKVYTEEFLRARVSGKICDAFGEVYKIVKENPQFIGGFDDEYSKAFLEKEAEISQLRAEKSEKKKQFKAGNITEKEWMAFCKAYKQRLWDDDCERRDFVEKYVESFVESENDIVVVVLKDYLRKHKGAV
ncbi:MAG: hypothetical protein MJ188_06830 [Treponema sp.]|nr:hypothetical protein [Treponema sp.]